MPTLDSQTISSVVEEVMTRLSQSNAALVTNNQSAGSSTGLFDDVERAVDAAERSQRQLVAAGVGVRDRICKRIKALAMENREHWGKFELDETGVGRPDHKVEKLELLELVPGVEFLKTASHSGDDGIALDEAAPWGVIGVITPVTHSIPTMLANAINMIAAGNAMVVNAHPSGAKSAALAAKTVNQAVKTELGIDPLICVIDPPTLKSAQALFEHTRVPMLVATGGPAVARAAMKQPKRAIVAGPGNPPVVVDETANLDQAARSIIAGGGFDNNLLCIGEKEVFVVDSVFDPLMAAMERARAQRLNRQQIDQLTNVAFEWQNDHYVVRKEMVGRDPHVMASNAGFDVSREVELLFGETSEDHTFVAEEQMMPFVPFVRVSNFDEALRLSIKHERGFGHTAAIHSNNLERITRMGRAMNVTLFAVNGPTTATLGTQGEGYPSYSIATPTGEGVTNPMTFTRFRRMSISGSLRIV